MVFAKLKNMLGDSGGSSPKAAKASSGSPPKAAYAPVTTTKNSQWLSQQGFEPPVIELDQYADRASFAGFLMKYRDWAVSHFNNERELVGLRLLPISALKFRTADSNIATVPGHMTLGGVPVFLGLVLSKSNYVQGRTGPWFQVGELVLFTLQMNVDKLRRETGISHMDIVHNMSLVHTFDAQEEIQQGTYSRKEAVNIGVIAPFESILAAKGKILRSRADESIPQDGSVTLADMLTMKKEGVPLTEHVTAANAAVTLAPGVRVYQDQVYVQPIFNPNAPSAGLRTRSGSASNEA